MSQLVTQTTTYGLNSDQYSISTLSSVGGVLEIMAGNPHDELNAPTPIVDFKSDRSVTFYGIADLSAGVTLPQKIIGTNHLADAAVTSAKIASNVTIVGTLTGTASKATADGEGNNIVNTYATKTALTTVDNKLSTFAPKASPTFTGTVTVPTPVTSDNSTKAASTAFVKSQDYVTNSGLQSNLANYLPLTGGTVSGNLKVNGAISTDSTIVSNTSNSMRRNVDNSFMEFFSATTYKNGAYIRLDGKDGANTGSFRVCTGNGSANIALVGTTAGNLTWNSKNIVRSVNGTNAGTDGNVSIPMVANSKGYVTATWKSGNSGYRKWSDGYIEQWGRASSSPVTYHIAFSSTNYIVVLGQNYPAKSDHYGNITSRSVTQFTYDWGNPMEWYAVGY